jgi:septal ring factor EnvC (AmiA/AmiB activator)
MSKTLQKVIGDMKTHQRQLETHQRHLEAVAKKIEVIRKKGASKKRKKRKR